MNLNGENILSSREKQRKLPESIRILTDNGIVLGSASAVLLNIVFNMVPQRKVKVKDEPVPIQSAVREA
ncbi:hypothetical protein A6E27_07910 [Bacillus cereus]|nr:hypothetical protein A6E27_07910 [Bacillus cereus]